jgi:hypothetical protein
LDLFTTSNIFKLVKLVNMTELPHKYEVQVKVVEKAIKISDQIKVELKASGMMDDKGKLKLKGVSPKMLKRMKEEAVDCPVLKNELPFIQCFVCSNFQSRVSGKVLCKGDSL